MAPNPRKIREQLQREVYDHIPKINCKQLCQAACSIIPCSVAEANAIQSEAGRPLEVLDGLVCSMLSNDGGCSVYDLRPAVCRLYGVTEGMECPFGCVPERWLPRRESMALLDKADQIGGVNPGDRARLLSFLNQLHTVLKVQGEL